MKVYKARISVIIGVILLVIAVLTIVIVKLNSEKKRWHSTSVGYEQVISEYQIEVSGLKEKVYEADLRVVKKQDDLILAYEQVERLEALNLRRVYVIGELRLSLKAYQDSLTIHRGIDTIEVVRYVTAEGTGLAVPVGTTWGWEDEYAESYAGINSDGTGMSGFDIKPFDLNLVLASRGIFSKDYVSILTTENPYINIDKNNIQLHQRKKAQPFLIGLGIGVLSTIVAFSFF